LFCASRSQSLQTQSSERKDGKLFGLELDSMLIMKVASALFGHVWHKGNANCIRPLCSHRGRQSCTERTSKEDIGRVVLKKMWEVCLPEWMDRSGTGGERKSRRQFSTEIHLESVC